MPSNMAIRAATIIASLFVTPTLSHPTHIHHHYHRQVQTELEVRQPSETLQARTSPYYDLNNDGIPDDCETLPANQVKCIVQGQWITFQADDPPSIPQAPSTALLSKTQGAAKTGTLPTDPKQFSAEQDSKWTVSNIGKLQFGSNMGPMNISGDKARTGVVGDKVIWNFGDMMCDGDVMKCGMSMGPAMFASTGDDKWIVNLQSTPLADNVFVKPFGQPLSARADAALSGGCTAWGMDNSNVAALNDTHGIVYSWEIQRLCPTASGYVDHGLAASVVTLGGSIPQAQRTSDLIAGPDAVQQGLIGIMADGDYIYSYTQQGSDVLVGRALKSDPNIFSSQSAYSYYSGKSNSWVQGIPTKADAANKAMQAPAGGWWCLQYGTVFKNNYLNKYMMFCDYGLSSVNFHIADKPEGPWSDSYSIFSDQAGYGAMVHPALSGNHETLYMTYGNDTFFDIYKMDFSGYASAA